MANTHQKSENLFFKKYRKMKPKILFIVGTHGNENYSIPVVKRLKKLFKSFDYIIGNPEAVKKNVRFIDSDLNRVYPGKKDGNYEERRSYWIFNKMKLYDLVIDIHGIPNETHQPFIILSNKINKIYSVEIANLFSIKKTVIWSSSNILGSSVKYFHGAGFAIEFGLKDKLDAQKTLERVLKTFLLNIKNVNPHRYSKKYFRFTGNISCEEGKDFILPENIVDFKKVSLNEKICIPILPRSYIRMGNNILFVNVEKLSVKEFRVWLDT